MSVIIIRRPREGGGRLRVTPTFRFKADSDPRLRGGDDLLGSS